MRPREAALWAGLMLLLNVLWGGVTLGLVAMEVTDAWLYVAAWILVFLIITTACAK